jgi:hypothetical protein
MEDTRLIELLPAEEAPVANVTEFAEEMGGIATIAADHHRKRQLH